MKGSVRTMSPRRREAGGMLCLAVIFLAVAYTISGASMPILSPDQSRLVSFLCFTVWLLGYALICLLARKDIRHSIWSMFVCLVLIMTWHNTFFVQQEHIFRMALEGSFVGWVIGSVSVLLVHRAFLKKKTITEGEQDG